jgi:cation diffusion facilitator family transporter
VDRLAVFVGAVGVWAGYPLADPLVGLGISAAILVIVWQSARSILLRMLDGVESETLDEIGHAAGHVARVEEVTDVQARWIGHRLHADVSVTVPAGLSVAEGHDIARDIRHQLLHHLPHLGGVMVHIDPYGQGGAHHHRVGPHSHDDLPLHSHE